jgi:hypothetical protein
MTKILDFCTERGPFSIELLDNQFVAQWLEHFLKMSQKYHTTIRPTQWPYVMPNSNSKNDYIDQVLAAIQLINSFNFVVPLPETVTREQLACLDLSTQQILNRLHRYVVVAAETRNRWLLNQEPSYEWVPYDVEEFNYAVNLLNQNIHNLEQCVNTPHKDKFHGVWKSIEILFDASKYNDVNIYFDDVDVAISDDMFPHLCLNGYDVWIKKDLLGKDYITAFVDHDSPTEFDVRPPTMYSGAIHINQNAGKDDIYNSSEFKTWLGNAPTNYHGNYPLGNIIGNKQNAIDCKTVEFIGQRDSRNTEE